MVRRPGVTPAAIRAEDVRTLHPHPCGGPARRSFTRDAHVPRRTAVILRARWSPDHTLVSESGHGLRTHAEQLAQHLRRVLTEHGGRCPHRARCLGQAHRGTHHLHLARARVLHLHEGAAGRDLRMRDDLRDVVDGAEGDALGQEDRLPLLVGLGQEDVLQQRDERGAVLRAVGVPAIARIVRQLRAADGGTEDLPELLATDRESKVTASWSGTSDRGARPCRRCPWARAAHRRRESRRSWCPGATSGPRASRRRWPGPAPCAPSRAAPA